MVDTPGKTQTTSVRFPVELLEWLDSYVRAYSYNSDVKITRNEVIISFLELMRGIIAQREKTEWNATHFEMIQQAIDDAAECREWNRKQFEEETPEEGKQ